MSNPALLANIRAMIRRYAGHLDSGDHILRAGSQQEIAHAIVDKFREIDPQTGSIYTNGYLVGPGGIGKTISAGDFIIGINTMPNGRYVLGDGALGKRVLVTVPTNELAAQWRDSFLGAYNEETGLRAPSVFGTRFPENDIGVYHPDLTDEQKEDVLSRSVVIIVHDSAAILHARAHPVTGRPGPKLRPQDFHAVLIDEVDDRVRGDATRRFYQEEVFPHCLTIGMTATHMFRSGKTVGHYIFGGQAPICEITHLEAVQRREIAPHINIIVEPKVDPASVISSPTRDFDDYTEVQQLRFIEQTGSDQAFLEVIKVGRHPVTGKPMRDMMKLHKAVNVEHAIQLAEQYKAEFGNRYAEAVWGETDKEMYDEMRRLIKWFLKTGEIKSVIQCKLWGRGTNIPELEMTVQHAPSLSPNMTGQFHTRASRKAGDKVALYLSPYIAGIDQLVIGHMLGGLYMLPDGYEFPASEGQSRTPSKSDPWPDIKGVKVHYTERQLTMFAAELHRQNHVDGLVPKPRDILTLTEAAQALDIEPAILQARVFTPLQEAYERKQARDKSVTIDSGQSGEMLHVRGKMFPERHIGFFKHEGQVAFCVARLLLPLCEHTLYGRLDPVPPERLDRALTKRLLGCTQDQIDELWRTLQTAFFRRKPYEPIMAIGNLEFSYDDFGFHHDRQGEATFFLSPDALVPAYRHLTGADRAAAMRWADQPIIRQCKTSSWLTEVEVLDALDINPLLARENAGFVKTLFSGAAAQSRGTATGQEWTVDRGRGKSRQALRWSYRWLPRAEHDTQKAACMHRAGLEWIKRELAMESALNDKQPSATSYRQTDRNPQPAANL